MFFAYNGIGVDIEEDGGAFYARIGDDIKLWGNTVEEVKDLVQVEVDDLHEKYYEDVFPPEYEHVGLSISREQFYSSIEKLASRMQLMKGLFQNPLANADETIIENWKIEYRTLMADIGRTYNLACESINKVQGW